MATRKRRSSPKRRDHGTPETQARRAYLAGNADPKFATYPLGVAWAQRDITEREREAGQRYAYLHGVFFSGGKLSVGATQYGEREGYTVAQYDDAALEAMRAELDRAAEALNRLGPSVRNAADNLCLYEHWPRWMTPRMPEPADCAESVNLRRALRALESVFYPTVTGRLTNRIGNL